MTIPWFRFRPILVESYICRKARPFKCLISTKITGISEGKFRIFGFNVKKISLIWMLFVVQKVRFYSLPKFVELSVRVNHKWPLLIAIRKLEPHWHLSTIPSFEINLLITVPNRSQFLYLLSPFLINHVCLNQQWIWSLHKINVFREVLIFCDI